MISAGEWVTASGEWVNDPTHGQQFKARFLKTSEPTSLDGIEKYLGSGMIRGIGPIYAKKLVRAFDEEVFDTIEVEARAPEGSDGHWSGTSWAYYRCLGPSRRSYAGSWSSFTATVSVRSRRCIYRTYSADAVQVMTENPYRLAHDIRRIGFKTADAIEARHRDDGDDRVRAGISYGLTEAMDEGHCGLPTEELIPLASRRN